MEEIVRWITIVAVTAPIWGAILWELWEGAIRPCLIQRHELDRLRAALLAAHGGRAGEMACMEEDRAWRRSDSFEQGKWRRVRKLLERHAGAVEVSLPVNCHAPRRRGIQ